MCAVIPYDIVLRGNIIIFLVVAIILCYIVAKILYVHERRVMRRLAIVKEKYTTDSRET